MEQSLLTFAGYVVDCDNEQLRLDRQPIRLTNKAFAVLRYLVEHPGQLVTKDALVAAVWPETVVSETTLTNRIGELRRTLGDDAKQPRFIETVQRRGYRFIGKVVSSQHSGVSREGNKQGAGSTEPETRIHVPSSASRSQSTTPVLVGREAELTQLRNLFIKAMKGERQVAFVTGEAGIGKTALVDAFLFGVRSRKEFGVRSHEEFGVQNPSSPTPNSELPSIPVLWIGWGQCIEQYGAGEAYLPMLEVLGRLGHGPHQAYLLSILNQYAPTWLAQLPALLIPAELEAVQRRIQGATRERMLREIVDAFDVLTAEYPLVIVLEDLHWSDPSTVELLAMLARRREPARLFVVGTYRAAELAVTNHPLKIVKQELVARGQATEIPMNFLSPAAVREYVSQRVTASESTDPLAEVVYRRTDGQPLFMVQVTDYLVQLNELTAQSAETITAVEQTLPHGLRELIEAQLGRLTADEQSILAVSSVVGAEFPAASVAAGMAVGEAQIEAVCERLARRGQFLEERRVRTWPDGTMSACYTFRHALYQEVLYKRIPEARRGRLHQCIGEWEEQAYGERPHEIAAELAVHFEQGRDYQRAVQYCQQASEKALQRHACQEAIRHVTKGFALLQHLPESPERMRQELLFHVAHGAALLSTKGFGAPEVEEAYSRAHVLSRQVEVTTLLVPVLCGLWNFYLTRAEFLRVRELADEILVLAQRQPDPIFLLQAHNVRGQTSMFMGEPEAAQVHIEQNLALYKVQTHGALAAIYGEDPGVVCHMYAALTRWLLGYPDQAVRHLTEGLHLAQRLGHPFGVAQMLFMDGVVSRSCGDATRVHKQTQTLISLCQKEDIPVWLVGGRIVQGWALTVLGQWEHGMSLIHQCLDDWRAMEMGLMLPYCLALLAEAYGVGSEVAEGLQAMTEALAIVQRTGERWYEAELWRLKGELTLQQESQKSKGKSQKPVLSVVEGSKVTDPRPLIPNPQAEAEGYFLKAIEVAHYQQAKSLELRAVMSLVRLRQQQATHHASHPALAEARRRLSEVYDWFTEGFDTKDLQEAKALIEELSR